MAVLPEGPAEVLGYRPLRARVIIRDDELVAMQATDSTPPNSFRLDRLGELDRGH
ncbi:MULTISPECIES: hypothetical protein [unclassified Bradyrhizobium]|uniref:hypothetical protein n=1 Tax=unclassified Bradyrhizobium TaxID=2631580 RepID=UPI001FFABFE2|nr:MULTISPECIES: hypothetical protein [unclassified Bradyrhizobium]MCK1310752.1 hypothetical protein [Bradyrhizobium sp. 45]MCK1698168.1 hypothetical protein [Bradyrhizobium sp. 144]